MGTTVRPAGASPETARADLRFAVLKLDLLNLLVPQPDIRMLEAMIDVDRGDPPRGGVGWIEVSAGRWPVYCFDRSLDALTLIPATRRICAMLRVADELFGIACDEVVLLGPNAVPTQPLPDPMVLPGSPVVALALYADTIACVSSAARLFAFARAHRSDQQPPREPAR